MLAWRIVPQLYHLCNQCSYFEFADARDLRVFATRWFLINTMSLWSSSRAWNRLPKSVSFAAIRMLSDTVAIQHQHPVQKDALYRVPDQDQPMSRFQRDAMLKEHWRRRTNRTSEDSEETIGRKLRDSGCSPFRFLRNSIRDGEASLGVVSVCLDAQWLAMQEHPRSQRQWKYRAQNENIATEVLRLIWSDEGLWLPLVAYDQRTTSLLCHFAVLEDIDRLLLDWVAAKVTVEDHSWRGSLLLALVTAHIMLVDTSADGILSVFLKAVHMQNEATGSTRHISSSSQHGGIAPISHLNLYPAAFKISGALAHPGLHYTSLSLFDSYIAFMSTSPKFEPLHREYSISRLNLYRPRRQGHRPAVSLLRKFQNGEPTLFSLESNAVMQHSLRNFIQRTALVASHNGDAENLRWIMGIFDDQFDTTKALDKSPLRNLDHSASTLDGGLLIRRVLV